MTVAMILLPLFVQVGLMFCLLFALGPVRWSAIKAGEVGQDALLDRNAFPARPRQFANAFSNQFELPVLFFVLTILALFTRKADIVFVVLAWVFVLSRIVHALVHVTSNNIRLRFPAYLVGVVVLLIMWVIFALSILLNI